MHKIILIIFINASFIQAMENKDNDGLRHVHAKPSMSAKDFIVAGVVAGGSIEFVNFVRKEERYKHIFQFGKRYPGFFLAGLSAAIGTGILYGQPIKSFLSDRFAKK